ncbi:hypothetical protein [Sphingomonas sp. BK235]|jgi:hypothetical protein|uniref:hypothetical protein n=1 Tax=Sphingomonas sp. BK235 TaxID=2512131 RepID=UPI0010429257|nr:hypothetical protein [Sphingomonas sp. BK235]TCP30737.1 hypothetical protein EV292_11295 [Sphingomonas sp. BK235]
MFQRLLPVLPLLLAAPLAVSARAPAADWDGTEYAQLTIHERLIIRIPRVAPAPRGARAVSPPPVEWDEKRGPECLRVTALTGAAIDRSGDVDLVIEGARRIRAKLDDDCPTLDFYAGFYLRPTSDGQICAGRDAIRSRSGALCPISKFRTLVPKKRK